MPKVVDLTRTKDADRVMRLACDHSNNPSGTYLLYHVGDYSDNINTTPLGRAAWAMYEKDKVHLVQKLIEVEPRRYHYLAVVR